MNEYDLVVIGGGAGELVATREARRRKASVVIVQDGPVGRRPHVHRVYVFRPRHSSQQHRRCGRRNRRAGLLGRADRTRRTANAFGHCSGREPAGKR